MKKIYKFIFFLPFLFLFLLSQRLCCDNATAGSDDAVDFPLASRFDFSGVNNRIANYAVMAEGFTFADALTTCTYASLFPINNSIVLRGGTLSLERPMLFNKEVSFRSGGTIWGNDNAVIFSSNLEDFEINYSIHYTASWYIGDNINSVDWSYDNNYLAAVTNEFTGEELHIFSFDGTSLVRVATYELGDITQTVRWHPLNYYLAVGRNQNTGDDLYIFYFDPATNNLSVRDSLGLGRIDAVDWHKTGTYLAVSARTTGERISVYEVSGGGTFVGTPAYDGGQAPDENVGRDALSWGTDSDYLVAGFDAVTTKSEFIVFKFDSAANTITSSVGMKIGQRVENVDWSPTGSYIAAGLDGSTERLRIYQLIRSEDGSLKKLEDKSSAYIGEEISVYAVNWRYGGDYLAFGRNNSALGAEFRVYFFEKNDVDLVLTDEVDGLGDIRAVRWSRDGLYVAQGSNADYILVYKFYADPVVFKDVVLNLNRDLHLYAPITFQGASRLHGNGFGLFFESDGEIVIDLDTELKIRNLDMYNLTGTNLRCSRNNSVMNIGNSKLYLSNNFNFSMGSILFEGDTIISGTTVFCYSSGMGSTINSQVMLGLSNNLTFSYAPSNAQRNLIYMQDQTSILNLNGCTLYSTKTGLQLTRGTLILENKITFSNEGSASSEAICLGDGIADNNLSIYLLAGSNLDIYGRLEYQNTN